MNTQHRNPRDPIQNLAIGKIVEVERMDGLIPWGKLEKQLARKYSKGKVGRKPYPLSVMLRIHVMQLTIRPWKTRCMKSNPCLPVYLPDETTILNFRHFLERNKSGQRLFNTIQKHLASQGLKLLPSGSSGRSCGFTLVAG